MVTTAENERLTKVGPGTPMGQLLREFWTPAIRSESLEAGGAPKRVRLLGENFVAFRSPDGTVGFMREGCPHRGASMALARNEDGGLRCIFHGWKMNAEGRCIDVPSEPPESREAFAAKVPNKAFPAREAGGMLWVYLGKREKPPTFFNFEFHEKPAESVVRCAIVHGNWLQGLEGQLDSAHLGMLHSSSIPPAPSKAAGTVSYTTINTSPRFEFIDKPYGFREAALRDLGDGTVYARIREVVFPYYSFIPGVDGEPRLVVVVVPMDDEWSAHYYYYMSPFGPVPQDYLDRQLALTTPNSDDYSADMGDVTNMWHQDREAMKKGHWSGLMKNFTYEDFIIEASMGPIADRTEEYLGTSDLVVVRTRRMFLAAMRDVEAGKIPFGLDQNIDYSQIRSLAIRIPGDTDWTAIDTKNPPPHMVSQAAE